MNSRWNKGTHMNESEHAQESKARPRLLPPTGLLLSLLVQVPLILWSWPLKPVGVSVLIGTVFLAGGVVLNIWADRMFQRLGVGVCPFSPVPVLIKEGPFRITRNPMYLGMVLISAGVPLIAGLYMGLWAPLLLGVWLQLRFVLPEEDFLRERLGMEYLLYASGHSRWLGLPGPQPSKMGARVSRST
jgi:protein-S-isoprenylcysteine O-methyltransferase Ste14